MTSGPKSTIVAGDSFEVDVSAEDPLGNVDPTFDGSVSITLNGGPANSCWLER